MKYVVVLGDGMADVAIPQLENKTPLQYAKKPNMDFLAKHGMQGLAKTVPDGMSPGSDTANLAVMGYDPKKYYTGRSPIEAVSMGIEMDGLDTAFRCNLVTVACDGKYEFGTMLDHSSDEITTQESAILINDINSAFGTSEIKFYPGTSYRNCMIWRNGPTGLDLMPPHDILEKKITDHLPSKSTAKILREMTIKSHEILKNHPINVSRINKGLNPANSIWLWGEGKKPAVPKFYDLYNINGSMISAVDLLKGIGILAGLDVVEVEGITGNIHTNFKGKAMAALNELKSGKDFVYIHVEAPDECGHRNELENKVKSIELIDEKIIGPLLEGLNEFDDYKILVLPDHPTPLALRTHTSDPVPFVIYQKSKASDSGFESYDEGTAAKTGVFVEEGYTLMSKFLTK